MKKFGLPRSRRLLHHGAFVRVQKAGLKIVTGNFLFLFHQNEIGVTRLGIAASRKLGNAVTRNRIRRMVREGFRLLQPLSGESLDLVAIPKRHIENPLSLDSVVRSFEELTEKYLRGETRPAERGR